jgi:hypothetical protein
VTRPIRRFLETAKTSLRGIGAEIHPSPIFILGNQKSGTSAIAGLLSRLTGLALTMDIKREVEHPEIERVRRGELSLSRFIERNKLGFSRPIIKEPNLTFVYDQLKDAFAEATFVFVYRDPRENIRSILNRIGATGVQEQLSDDQVYEMTPGWRRVFEGQPPGIIGEDFIDTLARRWDVAARIVIENEPDLYPVRFEDFLEDKMGVITRLARTLGLSEAHEIAEYLDYPFQPQGIRGVSWSEFYSREHLDCIERVCGESMERLGYRRDNRRKQLV